MFRNSNCSSLNMRFFVLLIAIASVSLAKSATLVHRQDLSRSLINNPRYFLYERDDGFIEVEDRYNPTPNQLFSITEEDVLFYFFNKKNPKEGILIKADNQLDNSVKLTGFDVSKPSLIIVHGWKNNISSAVNDLIKDEVLRLNDINVIVVDWSSIAKKFYVIAHQAVLDVGNFVGDFLISLDKVLEHRLNQVTMVGHSLGAHVAGNAGARSKGLIDVIIGLDPAGFFISKKETNLRLDPTDAKFVHVIHTSTLLGFDSKAGHVDFYPNGGKDQPGCYPEFSEMCAHSRAYEFYAESLYNNNFEAKFCNSWPDYAIGKCEKNAIAYMGGFPIQTNVPIGNYYLTTHSTPPYAE